MYCYVQGKYWLLIARKHDHQDQGRERHRIHYRLHLVLQEHCLRKHHLLLRVMEYKNQDFVSMGMS